MIWNNAICYEMSFNDKTWQNLKGREIMGNEMTWHELTSNDTKWCEMSRNVVTWYEMTWHDMTGIKKSWKDVKGQDVDWNLHGCLPNSRLSCWKSRFKWRFGDFLGRTVAHGRAVLATQNVSYKWCIIKFAWSRSKRSVELLKKQKQMVFGRFFFAELSRTIAQF